MESAPDTDGSRPSSARVSSATVALLFLVPLLLTAIPQAGAGGPLEFPPGDLIVLSGETQVIENRTLVLDGNVTVQSGGTLELRNASLLLNVSVNGTRTLTVETGGTLRLLDLDGVTSTAFDRSVVGAWDSARRYTAHFKPGSNVLVRASTLSGFGFSLVSPGLLIESSNVSFEGASLEAYEYMRVEAASPSFEGSTLYGDGTGSNYFFQSSSRLVNCTFVGHFVALSAAEGSSILVAGALIRDSVFALAANGAALEVSQAGINNSSSGVFLTNGTAANFTDVEFDLAAVAFGDAASSLAIARSFLFRVINNASEAVRNASLVVRDGTNATVLASNTGAIGAVGPVRLLASTENASGRFDEANYTATATKAPLSTPHAFSALIEPPTVVLLVASNLDPRITLVAPAPGAVLLAGVEEAFAVNVSDPDATPGGVSVTWRSSLQGALGSGATLPLALVAGLHTMEVEARDGQEGFRRLSFNVTVEQGEEAAASVAQGNRTWNATLWKTSQGSFGLTLAAPPSPPPLLVGPGLNVHASSGALVWAWARLEFPYDNRSLPHGTNETNLTVAHLVGSAWVTVPGASVDTNGSRVVANISRAEGLGWFALVAVKGPNIGPAVPDVPRLLAAVGRPFAFTVAATDTPGDTVAYSVVAAPGWLSITTDTGLLSGTPAEADRGLATFAVVATDNFGASSTFEVQVFVSGTLVNRPPSLINPTFAPAEPLDKTEVTIGVTYLDPDDDRPLFVEVVIDGAAHPMEGVDDFDANFTNGKQYVFKTTLAVGTHNITFRGNDGAPGHADVSGGAVPLVVVSDTLRALNNWFLALFASIAATLVLVVYVRSRAPRRTSKATSSTSEERATFLEGDALKPIPPQAPMAKKVDRKDALEREADLQAGEAARDEGDARAKLSGQDEDE